MAHILMTWELGGHLGHLSRLASLADELYQRGHTISLALRELHNVESVFGSASPYQFFQAPIFLSPIKASRNPLTFSEILQCNGFLSASSLRYAYQAWRSLYKILKPNLIVFDYAPTAMMAALGLNTPTIEIGTGFFILPKQSPLPLFGGAKTPSLAQRETTDKQVVATINHVLSPEKIPAITHVHELLGNTTLLITSFRELDCYPNRDSAEYVGILTKASMGEKPTWPTEKKNVTAFVYIKPNYAHCLDLLKTLQDAGIYANVYIPQCPQEIKKTFESSQHIILSDAPYSINATIEGADLVICHAGHDTIAHALMAGKPLLLIPQYVEQLEIAKRCAKIQACLLASPTETQKDLAKKIQALSQDPLYRKSAKAFANRYRHITVNNSLKNVADKCAQALEQQPL